MANIAETTKRGSQVKKFFRDIRAELKKVAWPTRKELLSYFMVVCVAIAIVCVLLWGLDAIFGFLLRPILK